MFDEFPDIPSFLRVENTASAGDDASVKARMAVKKPPCRRRSPRPRYDLPKTMDATAWALLKQIERAKAEKQAAKFRQLRERAGR